MKKKLNLLWNLKFNFFSVAERPLTFFAYFLNAKKVGRRRLVIGPAKAGGLPLFPHAASVPAPALAPVRSHFTCGETGRTVTGPTFWVCRAKSGAAFRCAKPPCAVAPLRSHDFVTRAASLGLPPLSLRSGVAPRPTTRRLSPLRLHFAARNRAYGYRPHLLALPRKIRRGPSLRDNPALVAVRLRFAAQTARRYRPHRG